MNRYLNRFNSTIVRELGPSRNTKITLLRLAIFVRGEIPVRSFRGKYSTGLVLF
jgi:hypothetical protein